MRKHYDAEVDRWMSTVKHDLSQIEFVASLSHKGRSFLFRN
jgi:hypothetical protein